MQVMDSKRNEIINLFRRERVDRVPAKVLYNADT